jgi:hypothetical protein
MLLMDKIDRIHAKHNMSGYIFIRFKQKPEDRILGV